MKNTLAIILLSTVYLSTMSCDKRNDAIPGHDNRLDISVIDANGRDLLDPDGENAINTNNIRLYYVIDGVEMEYEEQLHLDAPRGYSLYAPELNDKYYYLRIGLNPKEKADMTTTILRWDADKTDTIRSEVTRIRGGETVLVRKVWYNDELVWPKDPESEEDKFRGRYIVTVWED